MRTLVIDCATEACSVALFDRGQLIDGQCRMLGRGHAEQLVPMIAGLPGKGRAELIAVALGPGSFTGVRVGLAAARALAFAWGADLQGYPTLALVAAMARDSSAGRVTVAMTGGHGEWFVETFDEQGNSSAPLASLKPEDAVDAAVAGTAAGSQAQALVARRGSGQALTIWPDARSFNLLPAHAMTGSPVPIYGRAPDARVPGAAV